MTDKPAAPKEANHLAKETSPYLLQHAYNPVDWHPWGPEALEKARKEKKPIFLSIGYSACHWCHVMEHESFENEEIAKILNEHFISIKVDREERPDLDQIYMNAVQLLTGRGGWPMSVFLTPELEPFYGGTYFPPEDRLGMPGFPRVLDAVIRAWKEQTDGLVKQAQDLTAQIRGLSRVPAEPGELNHTLIDGAFRALDRSFDDRHGGFGGAPKFPHAMDLRLLLRVWWRTGNARALEMVRSTLDNMAAGGIYDQLGGGFHRYSVDERWLVPHFEKMLYDNALLVLAYLEAYQATSAAEYAQVVRETLDYVLREMTAPEGGFYSTQDADSEGEEGKFYVWTKEEIDRLLEPETARVFCYVYDVTEFGNWEGRCILNRPKTYAQAAKLLELPEAHLRKSLAEARAKLLPVRAQHVPPGRDEKILTDWNGLMIDACALAGRVLNEPRYLKAAAAAADFLLQRLRGTDGRLLHAYKDGQARFPAYLDDYAFLLNALVTLYETTFEPRWITTASELAEKLRDQFWDDLAGGFYFTAEDHEALIARSKISLDNATPSGNSVAVGAFLRLAKLTGQDRWQEHADKTFTTLRGTMSRMPSASSQLLIALDFHLAAVKEIALVGPGAEANTQGVLGAIYDRFLPHKVVAAADSSQEVASGSGAIPLLHDKQARDGKPTLYVCENFTCRAPAVGSQAAVAALDRLLPAHAAAARHGSHAGE